MKTFRYTCFFLLLILSIACSKDKDAKSTISCTIDGKEYSFDINAVARRFARYGVNVTGSSGESANPDRIIIHFDSDTTLTPGKYGSDTNGSAGIVKYGNISYLLASTNQRFTSFSGTPNPTELIITAIDDEYIEGTFRGDVDLVELGTLIARKTVTNGKFRARITD